MSAHCKLLHTSVSGEYAGFFHRDETGRAFFDYDEAYEGVDLSVAMPRLRSVSFGNDVVMPWLEGLVPESDEARASLFRNYDVSPTNPFDVLSVIGLDCQGAVRFSKDKDALMQVDSRKDRLVLLTEEAIGDRIILANSKVCASWWGEGERWSLGGNQAKLALRRVGDNWYSCQGNAPTTHILKPGVASLEAQALNEFICMKAAEYVGLNVSTVEYREFAGMPAIVVERYDRTVDALGNVVRIHQEDLCQALSIPPEQKYSKYGGPSARDCIQLMSRVVGQDAVEQFVSALFFNYLICATDAHAKNYSLLHFGKEMALAPLYDVATYLPYATPHDKVNLAMSIGGTTQFGKVTAARIERFCENNGLNGSWAQNAMLALCESIPDAFAQVQDDYGKIPRIEELSERMCPSIRRICKTLGANILNHKSCCH